MCCKLLDGVGYGDEWDNEGWMGWVADLCCSYLPSRVCVWHLNGLFHGYCTELCCPGSNGWRVGFC